MSEGEKGEGEDEGRGGRGGEGGIGERDGEGSGEKRAVNTCLNCHCPVSAHKIID